MKETQSSKPKIKQIIETDSTKAVNELTNGGDWILIRSYKKNHGKIFYMLGRITDYPEVNEFVFV